MIPEKQDRSVSIAPAGGGGGHGWVDEGGGHGWVDGGVTPVTGEDSV